MVRRLKRPNHENSFERDIYVSEAYARKHSVPVLSPLSQWGRRHHMMDVLAGILMAVIGRRPGP